ncbi:MAG: hypothetical protein VXZ72_01805 [Chlamydiota bacterium]|nr:hypothetical protein [Chlamydiota bacterium]
MKRHPILWLLFFYIDTLLALTPPSGLDPLLFRDLYLSGAKSYALHPLAPSKCLELPPAQLTITHSDTTENVLPYTFVMTFHPPIAFPKREPLHLTCIMAHPFETTPKEHYIYKKVIRSALNHLKPEDSFSLVFAGYPHHEKETYLSPAKGKVNRRISQFYRSPPQKEEPLSQLIKRAQSIPCNGKEQIILLLAPHGRTPLSSLSPFTPWSTFEEDQLLFSTPLPGDKNPNTLAKRIANIEKWIENLHSHTLNHLNLYPISLNPLQKILFDPILSVPLDRPISITGYASDDLPFDCLVQGNMGNMLLQIKYQAI